VNRIDALWPFGRYTLGALAAGAARLRVYGKERIPRDGGFIIALNHVSWIDIPLFAYANPRNTYYIAKAEAHAIPGLGQFIRAFGSFAVRRGESDREAVRRMREIVREGGCLGVFVEGTRQRSGELGPIQPGAAMVAVKEEVPIVCGAIYGSRDWKLGNFAPCSVAWGTAWSVEGMSRDAVSGKIAAELSTLTAWLAALHERGHRPWKATPPS
jgi:1-acyl-sn-glycerol-3-phosphate acyltransferase